MECKCYICGRTPIEFEQFIDSTLKSIIDTTPEIKTEQTSSINELEKIEEAIRSRNLGYLSEKNLLAILLTPAQLEKYGSWTRKKLAAAKECDYPFEEGELELIEHIFPGSCIKALYENNIRQWYDYSTGELDKLKSKIPQTNDAKEILFSGGYDVPAYEFKEVIFGHIFKKKAGQHFDNYENKNIPLKVMICPICDDIIERKIIKGTSGFLMA